MQCIFLSHLSLQIQFFTMHRPSNVDDGSRVRRWLESIGNWAKSKGLRVVFPFIRGLKTPLKRSGEMIGK